MILFLERFFEQFSTNLIHVNGNVVTTATPKI